MCCDASVALCTPQTHSPCTPTQHVAMAVPAGVSWRVYYLFELNMFLYCPIFFNFFVVVVNCA